MPLDDQVLDLTTGAYLGPLAPVLGVTGRVEGFAGSRVRWSGALAEVAAAEGAASEVIAFSGDSVYRARGNAELWRREAGDVGIALEVFSPFEPPRVAWEAGRLVLPGDPGGLVCLDPATGDEVWRTGGRQARVVRLVACGQWVGALLEADGGARELGLWSLRNGGQAMRVSLEASARGLALGRGAVATWGDFGARVFALEGPELFSRREREPAPEREESWGRRARGPESMLAQPGGEGWVLLYRDRMVGLDRAGREIWQVDGLSDDGLEGRRLVALGDRFALLRWCRIADSGVRVDAFSWGDGERVWERSIHGLGVPHSKYHHRADAAVCGGALVVLSLGSGGTVVESLDAEDGEACWRVRSR